MGRKKKIFALNDDNVCGMRGKCSGRSYMLDKNICRFCCEIGMEEVIHDGEFCLRYFGIKKEHFNINKNRERFDIFN